MGWRDAPIVAPAPAGARWQDAPVVGAPATGDGAAAESPSFMDDLARGFRLGVQDVGRGVAGLAGAPVDITALGLNAALGAADWVSGGRVPLRIPYDAPGSSVALADASTDIATNLFGEDAVIPWEDRTKGERVLGRAVELGTGAGVGSAGISAGKAFLPRWLTAPMEAAGSNARVMAGDIGAGVGSGAVMQTAREYLPEDMQGPVTDIITGLIGGIGGNKLVSVGESAGRTAAGVPNRFRAMPEGVIARDPETMLPVGRDDYARASALLQEKAFDPQRAADEITSYLATAGDGAHPTSALITGDPGLLSAERGMRVGDTAPDFIAADQAAMGAISGRVRATRPENANPEAPRPVAGQIIEDRLNAARGDVTTAQAAVDQSQVAAEELAAALAGGRSLDQASRDLHRNVVEETYIPDRAAKNAAYENAAADPNVVVRTENARNFAEEMLARNLGLNPALRDAQSVKIAEAFTFPREGSSPATGETLPATGGPALPPVTRTLEEAMRDRQALGDIESTARAQGDAALRDTAQGLRAGINADIRAAAESGVPGVEKLAAADQNYRENFAPLYRSGYTAKNFFERIDTRDPSAVPEATGGVFLHGGALGREAASAAARIIAKSPDPAAGMAAAYDYAVADAVRSGIIRKGTVSETALAKFVANREGMLSQLPEVKAQFDDLLDRVRAGTAGASRLAADLDRASQNLKMTEQQINSGALKLIAGSEPRKAVQSVFAQPDSVAAMREATQAFAGDPAAAAGWKAAVSDWLAGHVTTASRAGVARDDVTVSLAKLDRVLRDNETALAEVFSPDEMTLLKQANARLGVLSKRGTQASSGSATAENLRGLRGVITALANPAGIVTMMTRGALMAGSVERRIKTVADMFPDADMAANRLILRAATDPRIMEHMLRFPTTDAQVYSWTARLNEMLVAGEAAAGEADE
jgi:hypothetical protein